MRRPIRHSQLFILAASMQQERNFLQLCVRRRISVRRVRACVAMQVEYELLR